MMIRETAVISSDTVNEDGENVNLIDMIASPDSADTAFLSNEGVNSILQVLDRELEKTPSKSRQIICAYIVPLICAKSDISISDLEKYDYIDTLAVAEYVDSGQLPTKMAIANRFNREESSVNRTISNFLEKLKDEIKTIY